MLAFLQSPLTWLVLITVATLVTLLIAWNRLSSPRSFKALVKSTKLWRHFFKEQSESDLAIKAAQKWDENRIEIETKSYLLDEEQKPNAWLQLYSLGKKAHLATIRLLRDPELYPRLVKPNEKLASRRCPFDDVLELVGPTPGPEWVEALAPFLNDSDQGIRAGAIWAMGLTGASTIIPHIRKALNEEDRVCSMALMGLRSALERSHFSQEAREALFPNVLALLREGKHLFQSSIILFQMNGPKARDYFLSAEVFTHESPVLPHALEVLADNEILVPRDSLISLISSIKDISFEYSRISIMGQALRLLGRHQKEDDRVLLRTYSENPDENIAYGAFMGLLASLNLEDFLDKIQEKERKYGYESLPEKQRLFLATHYCDLGVFTGFYSYFNDWFSNTWPDALAGYRSMECTEHARNFEDAIAKFGPNGPSTSLQTRQKQLAEIINDNFLVFENQERPFHERRVAYLMCASRFVVRNAAAFSA